MDAYGEGTSSGFFYGNEHMHDSLRPPYASAIVMGLICALGTVFNSLVIFIILVLKEYKKTAHWYVLNLAFADVVFLLMLPFYLIEHLKEEWHFGLPLCVAYSAAFYVNYYAGAFFLTAMSFDRYVAIVHPVSSIWRKFRSNEGCWVITISVWLLSFASASFILSKVTLNIKCVVDFSSNDDASACILAGVADEDCEKHLNVTQDYARRLQEIGDDFMYTGPESFYEVLEPDDGSGRQTYETHTRSMSCAHPRFPSFIAWIYANFFLTFVLPVITMAICYGGILRRVLRPRIPSSGSSNYKGKNSRGGSESSSSSNRRTNHRITILVISLVVVFILLWLPFHVVHMFRISEPGIPWGRQSCRSLHEVVMLMAFSNSLLNPVLYTFLGANFDRRLRDVQRRLAKKNAVTKEFLASFKQAQKERYPYRGSLSTKTTKTTDTSDMPCGNSSDIRLQLLTTSCEDSHCHRREEKDHTESDV